MAGLAEIGAGHGIGIGSQIGSQGGCDSFFQLSCAFFGRVYHDCVLLIMDGCVNLPTPENGCKLYKVEYFCEFVREIGFKSRIFRVRSVGGPTPARFPCGLIGSLLSCTLSCIFPQKRVKSEQNGCFKKICAIEDVFALFAKCDQPSRKSEDEPAGFDHRRHRSANTLQDSKCDRALTAPPEFKSLMLRQMWRQGWKRPCLLFFWRISTQMENHTKLGARLWGVPI